MSWLGDYSLFLAQALTIGLLIVFIVSLAKKSEGNGNGGSLKIVDLTKQFKEENELIKEVIDNLDSAKKSKSIFDKLKLFNKNILELVSSSVIKSTTDPRDDSFSDDAEKKIIVVLDFKGDIKASAVDSLKKEISAVLDMPVLPIEVILRLDSPGGQVHKYGLAGAELDRLHENNIDLTVCIDGVAASGGYLMAVCAKTICAAPFAILGSIGVVAEIPNIHRFLKARDVDVDLHTAGNYKRTLTVLGENTAAGRRKFKDELENVHRLFKDWVKKRRPQVDIVKTSDGSTFFGSEAYELGLIDQVVTSEAILRQRAKTGILLNIRWMKKIKLSERISKDLALAFSDRFERFLSRSNNGESWKI